MTTHRTYIAIHVFLTVLATAFMVARFAAKYTTAKKLNFTSDDALLIAALVSALQPLPVPPESNTTHTLQLLMDSLFAVAILGMSSLPDSRRLPF